MDLGGVAAGVDVAEDSFGAAEVDEDSFEAAEVDEDSFKAAEEHKGKGVGKAMAEHSLEAARAAGFHAMQFNYVVETNTSAIALWESVGFEIVGRAPDAFRRPSGELVGALMMHRAL